MIRSTLSLDKMVCACARFWAEKTVNSVEPCLQVSIIDSSSLMFGSITRIVFIVLPIKKTENLLNIMQEMSEEIKKKLTIPMSGNYCTPWIDDIWCKIILSDFSSQATVDPERFIEIYYF